MNDPDPKILVCPACNYRNWTCFVGFVWHVFTHLATDEHFKMNATVNWEKFITEVERSEDKYQKACQIYFDSMMGVTDEKAK